MSYTAVKERYEAQKSEVQVRVDHSCKAHGCPNAGTMDRGLCFFHWRESDPLLWPTVTEQIRNNWPEMANWGREKREHEEAKAKLRREARRAVNAKVPTGLQTLKEAA